MKNIIAFLLLLAFTSYAEASVKAGAQSSALTPLIGVDISGLEDSYPGVACPATTGIDPECAYYRSKNYSTLRVAFSWEDIQPTLGGALNSTYLGYLTNIIRQAGLQGQKVILDCHNYGSYNGINIGQPGGPTYAQFANLWSQIATTVGGSIGLGGYDTMNEPTLASISNWQTAEQTVITAIRAVDTTSTIYIEGIGYTSAFQWVTNGNNALFSLTDPSNNLVFSAHAYGDYNNSGTYPTYPQSVAVSAGCTSGQDTWQCAQTMGDQLTTPTSTITTNIFLKRYTPFIQACQNNNVKCWIGESGVPYDDANWLTALNNGISYLQANNILFTYWSAGPYSNCQASSEPGQSANCGYPLGIEPYNLSTAPLDTIQASVPTSYSNAYSPSTYQMYGPQYGSSGVASSNFTVVYNGYVKKSFTITPNDSGAGGTFTPSSIACSAGFNCLAAFTYTASSSNVFVISATNTGGLTNPSSLGFATIADQFSASGASPVNAVATRKIVAPYIGNAIQLRRSSDNAVKSFGFTSNALGSPINTAAIQAWNGTGETDTIASTQIIVQYSPQFSADAGVSYVSSGTPLVKVTLNPTVGQYTVSSSGHYGFNSGDIGNTVRILYTFPMFVVTWYDQSGNGNNAGIVQPDGTGPTVQNSNQPAFLLGCQNSLPCLSFNGTNYMDMVSPFVTNQTQQTVLGVFSPSVAQAVPSQLATPSTASILNGSLLSWSFYGSWMTNFYCNTNSGACSGGWGNSYDNEINSDNNTTRTYSVDAQWHATGSTYKGNVTDGNRTFFDGQITDRVSTSVPSTFTGSIAGSVLTVSSISGCPLQNYLVLSGTNLANVSITGQATATGSCSSGGTGTYNLDNTSSITLASETITATAALYLPYNRNTAKIGYSQAFNPSSTFTGQIGEIIVLNNEISNSSAVAFQNDEDTAWGITTYGGWTAYSPTLNQSTTTTNALPWEGVNNFDGGNNGNVGSSTPFFAGLGANIERVVTSWYNMQPTLGQPLNSAFMANLASNVATLNNAGIDALIDNHSGAAYNGCVIDSGGACPTASQFASYWGLVATYFLSNPKVAFDLANEPANYGGNITAWGNVIQGAITAIRNTGATQYIFVELNNGYASCNGGSTSGTNGAGTVFLSLTDPLNKLVYECHNYFDGNWSGGQVSGYANGGYSSASSYAGSTGTALSDLQTITTWAVANNVKLFLGEFGLSFTQSMYFEDKVALDLMASNLATNSTGGWAGWTAWGGGSGWGNGYQYFLQPQIFDANTVPKPVDRYLNAFWTGHTWPCITYASGSSGPCATTNWPYTVKFP